MFTNSHFPIDTAVIRSSLLAILCKVSVLTNFPKFTRKHLCFLMNLQIYRVLINLTKKEISARMFSLEFCEISHNTFLITNLLDGCSCIKACSACYIQRVYSWKFCTLTKNLRIVTKAIIFAVLLKNVLNTSRRRLEDVLIRTV